MDWSKRRTLVDNISIDGNGISSPIKIKDEYLSDVALSGEYVDLLNKVSDDTGIYGFLNQIETNLLFDGTNLFTLVSVGASWSYYRNGVKNTITGNRTLTLPNTPVTTAMYFIFIDDNIGTLSYSTVSWTLEDTKVPVAILYFNNSLTPKFILENERHQCLINRRDHLRDHLTEGTKYSRGGLLSGYTLNTATDAGNTFGVSEAVIFDEDLRLTLAALTDVNGVSAIYRLLYRNSASTYAWSDSDMPFYYTGAGTFSYINYDNAGTLTASINNRYVNYYLVMSNAVASNETTQGTSNCPCRFALVMGRASHATTGAAYAEDFSNFDFTGFPLAESVAIWMITFNTAGVANTIKGRCRIDRVQRITKNIVQSSTTISQSWIPDNITLDGDGTVVNPATVTAQVQTTQRTDYNAVLIAASYTLVANKAINVRDTLPNGVNTTIILPSITSGIITDCRIYFNTGATLPTIVYSGFTPVWQGGTAPILVINKRYVFCFDIIEYSTGNTYVAATWGVF